MNLPSWMAANMFTLSFQQILLTMDPACMDITCCYVLSQLHNYYAVSRLNTSHCFELIVVFHQTHMNAIATGTGMADNQWMKLLMKVRMLISGSENHIG